MSPSLASSIALRVNASASPSSKRSAATVARLRAPRGRPLGLPLCREASAAMRDPLLEVNGLKKHFPIRRGLLGRVSGHVYAVDGLFLFGHFNREHDRNFTIRRRPDREKPRRRRCQDGHALLARPTPVQPATNYPGELDLAAAALRQCRSLSYLVQGVWVCSNTCLTSINRLPRAIRSANYARIGTTVVGART